MKEREFYIGDNGAIVEKLDELTDGVFSGVVIKAPKDSKMKTGDKRNDFLSSQYKKFTQRFTIETLLGNACRLPYIKTMWVKSKDTDVIDAGDIRNALIVAGDVLERYKEVDLKERTYTELDALCTTAYPYLRTAEHDLIHYYNMNRLDYSTISKKRYTYNSLREEFSKCNGIETSNLDKCLEEIEKAGSIGFYINYLELYKPLKEITKEYINEIVHFPNEESFESFNELFYIINGIKL